MPRHAASSCQGLEEWRRTTTRDFLGASLGLGLAGTLVESFVDEELLEESWSTSDLDIAVSAESVHCLFAVDGLGTVESSALEELVGGDTVHQ
jgi:hypothetical protein